MKSVRGLWNVRNPAETLAPTDPYRPPVGATPLDDIPFVTKSGEELPSGRTELVTSGVLMSAGAHVDTVRDSHEVYDSIC